LNPVSFGQPADQALLHARLRKAITKDIGILYFHLPQINDPRSVLYRSILGIDDLDRVGRRVLSQSSVLPKSVFPRQFEKKNLLSGKCDNRRTVSPERFAPVALAILSIHPERSSFSIVPFWTEIRLLTDLCGAESAYHVSPEGISMTRDQIRGELPVVKAFCQRLKQTPMASRLGLSRH
jgi:hypothetical protein